MLAPMPEVIDRDGASRFVDALSGTSAAAWLKAAEIARASSDARARAWDVIVTRAEKLSLYDDLWHLADAVETAAWYTLPEWCRAPRTGPDAQTRKDAIDAARLAAYGVLLRAYLTEQEFQLLCEPFRDVVEGGPAGL